MSCVDAAIIKVLTEHIDSMKSNTSEKQIMHSDFYKMYEPLKKDQQWIMRPEESIVSIVAPSIFREPKIGEVIIFARDDGQIDCFVCTSHGVLKSRIFGEGMTMQYDFVGMRENQFTTVETIAGAWWIHCRDDHELEPDNITTGIFIPAHGVTETPYSAPAVLTQATAGLSDLTKKLLDRISGCNITKGGGTKTKYIKHEWKRLDDYNIGFKPLANFDYYGCTINVKVNGYTYHYKVIKDDKNTMSFYPFQPYHDTSNLHIVMDAVLSTASGMEGYIIITGFSNQQMAAIELPDDEDTGFYISTNDFNERVDTYSDLIYQLFKMVTYNTSLIKQLEAKVQDSS